MRFGATLVGGSGGLCEAWGTHMFVFQSGVFQNGRLLIRAVDNIRKAEHFHQWVQHCAPCFVLVAAQGAGRQRRAVRVLQATSVEA